MGAESRAEAQFRRYVKSLPPRDLPRMIAAVEKAQKASLEQHKAEIARGQTGMVRSQAYVTGVQAEDAKRLAVTNRHRYNQQHSPETRAAQKAVGTGGRIAAAAAAIGIPGAGLVIAIPFLGAARKADKAYARDAKNARPARERAEVSAEVATEEAVRAQDVATMKLGFDQQLRILEETALNAQTDLAVQPASVERVPAAPEMGHSLTRTNVALGA